MPGKVKDLISDGSTVLLDVRDEQAYNQGHISGAVNVPEVFNRLCMSAPEGLIEMHRVFKNVFSKAGLSRDKKVIFYEDYLHSRYGGSCRGYWLLNYLGHFDVGILYAGLIAWLAMDFPLVTDISKPKPVDFQIKPQPNLIATKDDVLKAIDDPSIILFDNRDEDEWLGQSSSPYGIDFAPRKGRIPGSVWIEWHRFMDMSDPIPPFRSKDEIIALCAEQGLYPDSDIIIYCFKGARSSNTYIALKHAGFKKVRNYFASWNEWSRHPELPIEEGPR